MAATNITIFQNDYPDRAKSDNLASKSAASGNWHYVTLDPGRKYQIQHSGMDTSFAFSTGILKVKYDASADPLATTFADAEQNVTWISSGGVDNPLVGCAGFSIQGSVANILIVIKEIEVGKFGGEANG